MLKSDFEKFKDQIWLTRVSRTNTEQRLMNKVGFIQFINIYYSCVTIMFSIISLLDEHETLSLINVIMAISLLVAIVYLQGQDYLEYAKEYRANYTSLHLLELKLKHLTENDTNEIKVIEKEYCQLLASNGNHIKFDYYCTIHDSNANFKCNMWPKCRLGYYFGVLWRLIVKFIVLLIPIVVYFFCK